MMRIPVLLAAFLTLCSLQALSQATLPAPAAPRYDLSRDPVLYTVGYAHLDTEWRWDYETTVNQYLRNTLDDNFQRLDKYKPYVFTFSGARRYKMMKEYYPEKYERLKKYISQGRWFVGGSSVDECDVNVPSPESVIRQVLYGNGYFKSEYGKESVDFLLPDCFGFQAHLPSVLAHAGLKGFSTQKLSWGSAAGIPFNVGNWNGPDGKGIIAALNATDYGGEVSKRLDTSTYWNDRVTENGKKYGLFADYRYYGVGDEGGAPREEDVRNAVGSIDQPGRKFNVYLTSSDQLFRDITPEQRLKLPAYTGDLLLTEHSAGSLTSQAFMKRWNRKNEQLALAAEAIASAADWLGALPYPQRNLNEAWWLVLGSQMHDILPGTSIPKAYEYAWNDEVLALNKFAATLENSVGAVVRALDTRGSGRALVVYNPLAIIRKDVVEAELKYPDGAPKGVKVVDGAGMEVPVQILASGKESIRIAFLAAVPSVGLACFDVQPVSAPAAYRTGLSASGSVLDNEFLKVTVSADGDIVSIIDKKLGKEILSGPARLEFQKEHPEYWPAWNMDWKDRQKPPAGRVGGPSSITLVEKGPVRGTIRVDRKARGSEFTQYISLAAGKENLTVRNVIRWQSRGVSLKAAFPLTASASEATYNLGFGTIARGNNEEKKYEVPSREWFDLTDKSGNFGVTVIEDCKFGSDKPDDRTLRLTLLYTPAANFYHDQATQDWGIHEVTYGIYSHKGDWRAALSEWQGRSLNQPLRAFEVPVHAGALGKSFSFAKVSVPQADIRAIKKAENGKDLIIRLQELTGRDLTGVEVTLAGKILKAWEVDGQEHLIGEAVIKNGKLVTDMPAFGARSYALQLEAPAEKLTEPASIELPLAYDADAVSYDRNRKDGSFGDRRLTIPAELFPGTLTVDGIRFNLGQGTDGKFNALVCRGQKITLPKTGKYDRVYLLAAALTDTAGVFRTPTGKATLNIGAFNGNIGQADLRTWDKFNRISGLKAGHIRRDEVAWFAPHLHGDTSNIAYKYAYLYKYDLPVGTEGGTVQLPDNAGILVFAMTAADNPGDGAVPLMPLYDDFSGRTPLQLNLPVSYVTENVTPTATIRSWSNENIAKLPGKLTMKDYADIHQPNGVTASYYFSASDSTLSGSIRSGMAIPALTDGMFDLMPSDSLNDRWSSTGEGRIVMDLQRDTELDSLHLFTSQSTVRGAPSFSLWGAPAGNQPDVTGDPGKKGWTFIALAQPRNVWGNGKVLYTIKPIPGQSISTRYLMWVTEDCAHGPYFFREADVFERQK